MADDPNADFLNFNRNSAVLFCKRENKIHLNAHNRRLGSQQINRQIFLKFLNILV